MMWFFLVIEPFLNDEMHDRHPIFYERDDEFYAYIMQSSQVQAEDGKHTPLTETERVMIMFLDLIKRSWSESEHSMPVSVVTENGFMLWMKRPMDDVMIFAGQRTQSGDNHDKKTMLEVQRRMSAANAILKFLYGPCYNVWLRRSARRKDNIFEWSKISLLINTWVKLYESEQSYLVEAVEMIQFDDEGDNHPISIRCRALFEKAVDTIKHKIGVQHYRNKPIHTILTVGGKVVEKKCSKSATMISNNDVLLAMVVSKAFFPYEVTLDEVEDTPLKLPEDKEVEVPPTQYGTETDSDYQGESDVKNTLTVSGGYDSNVKCVFPSEQNIYSTCSSSAPTEAASASTNISTNLPKMEISLDPSKLLLEVLEKSDERHCKKDTFVHMRVFIKTAKVEFMPACLYVLHITLNINLIIIAEFTDESKVGELLDPMKQLYGLLHPESNNTTQAVKVVNQMSGKIQKLSSLGDHCFEDPTRFKHKVRNALRHWQREIVPIQEAISMAGSTPTQGPRPIMGTGLQASIIDLIARMKDLFSLVCMKEIDLSEDAGSKLETLRSDCRSLLQYIQWELIKMAKSYLLRDKYGADTFPGLLHFIYIDRHSNCVKTPSLELASDDTSLSAQVIRYMRKMLWRVLPWIYSQVAKGYTEISITLGDLVFTYELILYRQITFGNSRLPFPPRFDTLFRPATRLIGDFNGRFYRGILSLLPTEEWSVHPLELLTVHLAVTSEAKITKQSSILISRFSKSY